MSEKTEIDLPVHITKRLDELTRAKVHYAAQASACEGAIMELTDLRTTLSEPLEVKKEEKKPNAS